VLVLGAGVAGLRDRDRPPPGCGRLGLRRPRAAREQVESLGATLSIELPEGDGGVPGGYAKELSERPTASKQELVAHHVPIRTP